jgi:hypothetical protein
MLLGTTVLCALVLLALLAERAASWISGGDTDSAFYRCAGCDLRYPKRDLEDPALRLCPQGHLIVREVPRGAGPGLIAICVCCGFLGLSLLLLVTGVAS